MIFTKEEDLWIDDFYGLRRFILVGNAAGSVRTLKEVEELAEYETVGAITAGTYTIEERIGNKGNVYFYDEEDGSSLNSNGMPNLGIKWCRENLPKMVKTAHDAGKPFFVSVAGETPSEYAELTKMSFAAGASGVELNASCPNRWIKGKQGLIPCFDQHLLAGTLLAVREAVGRTAIVGVKLSPYSDPNFLKLIANTLSSSGLVKFVTVCNTFPNAYDMDENGNPLITFGNGLAGLGGSALRRIALGQVLQFRQYLLRHIQIIGVGGIATGGDAKKFIKAGALVLQVGTAFLRKGPNIFSDIVAGLVD